MSDLSRNAGIVVILLAVSVAFGAWATMQDPAVGEQLISLLKESIMGEALDSSGAMMAVMLFFNNLQACVLMFI
ncbi:MAG TPA: stage II sporulation protein M, partial [Methanolinea sp.]|nr:stage II sporulation protein M [Methanolinea sp.]